MPRVTMDMRAATYGGYWPGHRHRIHILYRPLLPLPVSVREQEVYIERPNGLRGIARSVMSWKQLTAPITFHRHS
jgi:hypothetical protein